MQEQDLAKMTEEQLKAYCEMLERQLALARWYLANKICKGIK